LLLITFVHTKDEVKGGERKEGKKRDLYMGRAFFRKGGRGERRGKKGCLQHPPLFLLNGRRKKKGGECLARSSKKRGRGKRQ